MKKFLLLLIAIFTLVFVGCAKTEDTEVFRYEISEIEVTVGSTKEIGLIMGNFNAADLEFKLSPNAILGDEENETTNVIEILEVEGNAVTIKANEIGEIYLHAFVKNTTALDAIKITVAPKKIDFIQLTSDKDSIYIGETAQLSTVFTPENDEVEIVYKSLNENIATVDANGVVTAVGVGNAVIEAYNKEDDSLKAQKTIKVKYFEVEYIELSEGNGLTLVSKGKYALEINVGETFEFKPVAYGKGGTTDSVPQEFIFSAGRGGQYVELDTVNGILKPKSTGTATISIKSATSTSKSVEITCNIGAAEVTATSVSAVVGCEYSFTNLLGVYKLTGTVVSGADVITLNSDATGFKVDKLGKAVVKVTHKVNGEDKFAEVEINTKQITSSVDFNTTTELVKEEYADSEYYLDVEFSVSGVDGAEEFTVKSSKTSVAKIETTDNGFKIKLVKAGEFVLTITIGDTTVQYNLKVK